MSEIHGAMYGGSFLSPLGDCAWPWQTPLVIWEHSPEATLLLAGSMLGIRWGAVSLLSKPCPLVPSAANSYDTYLLLTHIINKLNLMVVCS